MRLNLFWLLVCVACAIPAGQAFAQDAPGDQYFESEGLRLRFSDQGAGEAVVLIHGFGGSLDDWVRSGITSALNEAGFRTIAYDSRGHGRSDKPHEPDKYGPPEVEDVVHLLDHLGIKQAHIVGYSRGSAVANGFWALHPERLETVIFGGYGYDGQTLGPVESLDRSEVGDAVASGDAGPIIRALTPPDKPIPTQEQIAHISRAAFAGKDVEALAATFRGPVIPSPTREQLASNRTPALAIAGESDAVRAIVEKMAQVMTSLEVLVIPAANHGQTMSRPEFKTGLLGFLTKNTDK